MRQRLGVAKAAALSRTLFALRQLCLWFRRCTSAAWTRAAVPVVGLVRRQWLNAPVSRWLNAPASRGLDAAVSRGLTDAVSRRAPSPSRHPVRRCRMPVTWNYRTGSLLPGNSDQGPARLDATEPLRGPALTTCKKVEIFTGAQWARIDDGSRVTIIFDRHKFLQKHDILSHFSRAAG